MENNDMSVSFYLYSTISHFFLLHSLLQCQYATCSTALPSCSQDLHYERMMKLYTDFLCCGIISQFFISKVFINCLIMTKYISKNARKKYYTE